MPKRLLCFLILLLGIVGFTILLPITNRMSAESQSQNTSVSIVPTGYKALYLLLQKLNPQPVKLWQHSMMLFHEQKHATLWFIEPGQGLFFDGAAYTSKMRNLALEGNHLVFVLKGELKHDHPFRVTCNFLEKWYDIPLDFQSGRQIGFLKVKSHFQSRQISSLGYKPPLLFGTNNLLWGTRSEKFMDSSPLLTFHSKVIPGGDVLLETTEGRPLIVRFKKGKGSVTIVLNSNYFENGQLVLGDNAPLAVALSELNPNEPNLFEVYSSGFNENRDILTYLATSSGLSLLLTLILILIAFSVAIAYKPSHQKISRRTSNEHYFTQEIFIDSLASHYLQTRDWTSLYEKLVAQFKQKIDHKIPGMSFDRQVEYLAQNSFYDVSLDELKICFSKVNITSQRDFVEKSQRLLKIEGKVISYEQYSSSGAS